MATTNVKVTDNITASNTIDVVGLNNIGVNLKLDLPQPFKTENSNALDIKPLKADLGSTSHLTIDPFKLELEAKPFKTDRSPALDLKPAVIDLCLTNNVGKLPNVCIRQPYHHHVGFTLFGMEVWGFTMSGQQEMLIEELDRQPKVAWGGGGARALSATPPDRPKPQPPARPASRDVAGLRIRLEP